MTREQVAEKIRWPMIISLIGIVNGFSFLPQLRDVFTTHAVDGISLTTLVTIFVIQVGFSLQGFFKRDRVLMYSNICGACVNALLITSVLYFSHRLDFLF